MVICKITSGINFFESIFFFYIVFILRTIKKYVYIYQVLRNIKIKFISVIFTFNVSVLSTWGNTYVVVIGVALIIGVAKGTKAVFQTLIIPDYVSLERLPAAYGMQMVCNGILSIIIGPFIGKEIFLILSLINIGQILNIFFFFISKV